MKFSELMGLTLAFSNRIDNLWQRILYAHAAIVGVMVFFATSDNPFPVARFLVFSFYTLNTLFTIFAFLEAYSGIKAAVDDLQKFPKAESVSNIQTWLVERRYTLHASRRIVALVIVWMVLAYLLIYPLAIGFFRN